MKRPSKALLLGLLLSGCVTPSIPLPPPVLEDLTFTSPSMGMVRLDGICPKTIDAEADVDFYVDDKTSGHGAIAHTTADGCFTTGPFVGAAGDTMVDIWYENSKSELSASYRCTLTLDTKLDTTICH